VLLALPEEGVMPPYSRRTDTYWCYENKTDRKANEAWRWSDRPFHNLQLVSEIIITSFWTWAPVHWSGCPYEGKAVFSVMLTPRTFCIFS